MSKNIQIDAGNTYGEIRSDMNSISKDLDYIANLVIFMAAYDFGRRMERGEDVTAEMEGFKTSMKSRAVAKGMVE